MRKFLKLDSPKIVVIEWPLHLGAPWGGGWSPVRMLVKLVAPHFPGEGPVGYSWCWC